MSYFTLKDGQRLYYEDKGHGADTLIMMHGWTSSHDILKSRSNRFKIVRDASFMITADTAEARKQTSEGKSISNRDGYII